MGQLYMPISLAFPLIHLWIESVDNRLLSVDNKMSLGITFRCPPDTPYPRYCAELRSPPYILQQISLIISEILVNLASLPPAFIPNFIHTTVCYS